MEVDNVEWTLDKGRPIVPQLCEQVCLRIALGEFLPGERLLSVREIALLAGVNPNTVQKTFDRLSDMGILYSQRSLGWFVSPDTAAAREALEVIYREKTDHFFAEMQALGMSRAETMQYLNQYYEKGNENHE